MVTIQDTELKEGISEAIDRARRLAKPVLVSEVHKIGHIDPVDFFAAGSDQYLGERFFWKDPSGQALIIGLGICKQIQSDQAADRFLHTEKEWKRFIEDSVIFNPYPQPGLGPVMFGGFSFDPLKQKTPLWSKFSDSLFHLPKYMLSIIDGQSYLTTNVVCTQHDDASLAEKVAEKRQEILSSAAKGASYQTAKLLHKEEIDPGAWKNTVSNVVDDLQEGSLKKVVLARELRLYFKDAVQVEMVLSRLLKEQRESFIFAFESNGDCFIGASPERLVKKAANQVKSTCLAGSIARGKTPEEDKLLGETLLTDQKNLIEHQYVVDMIKEAMADACEQVDMPSEPQLLKMRDIQHLYTPVTGKLLKNKTLLSMVKRLHPTPALGGSPKCEAMAKIREVEAMDRGFYAAPLGWMDYHDNGEFAVSIRSGLIQGGEASLFAGCGIVADSDSESEYMETGIKFRPMLTALGGRME
ncbi:isochorismate synthase [Bacillus sp. V3-13]|uniref:isochorismate synthase n=1 Tax=Bacillus sp. V3-13 TaxID=2053728 RepID=UPI000C7716E3|nr:isochorismate synthase [Bacillus sp. V3-13]PLR79417.1 isochorismate synthase [Bacillus sp. V3-13]